MLLPLHHPAQRNRICQTKMSRTTVMPEFSSLPSCGNMAAQPRKISLAPAKTPSCEFQNRRIYPGLQGAEITHQHQRNYFPEQPDTIECSAPEINRDREENFVIALRLLRKRGIEGAGWRSKAVADRSVADLSQLKPVQGVTIRVDRSDVVLWKARRDLV